MNDKWKSYHSLAMLGILVAAYIVGQSIPARQVVLIWLVFIIAMALFTMVAAHGVTGRFWLGWLINEQFRMSLSRLQMFLWTIIILSAFFASVLANIRAGHELNALNIEIPEELWLAMGISTTALVGSPLILSQKQDKKTNKREVARTDPTINYQAYSAADTDARQLVDQKVEENFRGHLQCNKTPDDAQINDLIRGEETSNWNVLDLSRLQNLFFTIILVGGYAATLGGHLAAAAKEIRAEQISNFPELNAAFVALLGISHAGYLVSKAIDKQKPDEQDGA